MAARHRARRRASPVPGVLAVSFVLLSAVGVGWALLHSALQDGGTPADPADETAPGGAPLTVPGAYDTVPDSCAAVRESLADRLAPGADKTSTDEGARQSACTWATFTPGRNRQLTVELRAIAADGAGDAAATAERVYRAERRADRSARAPGAPRVPFRDTVSGIGDAGYATYRAEGGVGTAIVNVRAANLLITVHYSGDVGGDPPGPAGPLSRATAVRGGVDVARSVADHAADARG